MTSVWLFEQHLLLSSYCTYSTLIFGCVRKPWRDTEGGGVCDAHLKVYGERSSCWSGVCVFQRREVSDLQPPRLLHRVDSLRPGLPQHGREVHGGRSDIRHLGLQLGHADLHLSAQVLRHPGES